MMIPAPLAVPVDVRPPPASRPQRTLRWASVVALVVAALGAVVWAAGYSPLGYQRFDVFEATREMTFRQAGDYVVYEEFPGAGQARLPTPVEVLVTDDAGRSVPVLPALEPGQRGAPDAYDTPWHEGRALAHFEIDDGGTYLIEVAFLPGEAGRFRPFEQVTVAVGRQPTFSWMAGWWGAVVFVGIPVLVALGLVLAAGRVARRSRRGDGRTPGRAAVDGR